MVAVLALAVASTAVLVLTDSAQWLRFGVLAALWAALLGVFLASRFRKAMAEKENEVADLQSVYELELEREVAARREYELEVEAAARKRVEEANREDLAELRNELRHLRESLERLTGGEVLVERFALQAQSTRMRSLSDRQQRVVASGEDSVRMRRSIAAGQGQVIDQASTEMIPRSDLPAAPTQVTPIAPVRREPQRRESQRPPGYRPEPSRPQTPRDGADDGDRQRRDAQAAPQPTRVARPVRQEPRQQPVQQPVQRVVRAESQPPAQPQQQQAWPQAAPAPAAQRPTQGPQRRPQQVARQAVRREPTQGDVGLSARLDARPVQPSAPTPIRPEPQQPIRPEQPIRAEQPIRPEPPRPEPAAASTGGHRRAPEQTQRAEPVVVERSRHRVDQPRVDQPRAEQPRVEPDEPPAVSPPVEEAPKDWQSYREWRQDAADGGDPETTGAHAAGKSVTELLAAHGNQDDTPRRHRRRAE
ncbi:MAG TPA: DUF6779 domain-containing protein [Pseudonocardiaceae bacterium]